MPVIKPNTLRLAYLALLDVEKDVKQNHIREIRAVKRGMVETALLFAHTALSSSRNSSGRTSVIVSDLAAFSDAVERKKSLDEHIEHDIEAALPRALGRNNIYIQQTYDADVAQVNNDSDLYGV